MNKKFCIANWKMYLNNNESTSFVKSFINKDFDKNVEVVLCPAYVSIKDVSNLIYSNDSIQLGAQDMSLHQKGAYTGDVSLDMLDELSCSYVIIGHSERRLNHNENNLKINKKLFILDESNITPIICIGESFEERKAGITKNILQQQISEIFANNKGNNKKDCIIAYEPIWAIGTGISADMQTIEYIHNYLENITQNIAGNYRNIYLLYGGSVNENNASEILNISNVDGFLIGSSSIDPNIFYNIYNKF